jgi:hypothetical protein
MKNRFFLVIATVAAVAIMTSCAKVPQEALDAAKAAIETAQTAQADVYFPAEYAALNDQLTVINQDIETQKSKTAKDFKLVKTNAEAITLQAGELAAKVEAKKAEVKAEAETMMTGVTALLDEAKALLLKAVLDEMKNEIAVVETSLTDAKALYDGGTNYMVVVDKVKAATETLNGIIAELKAAIVKAGGKV